jgi:hypothetical protein
MNKQYNLLPNSILCNFFDHRSHSFSQSQSQSHSQSQTHSQSKLSYFKGGSNEFKKRYVVRINNKRIVKYDTRYIKFSQNQLQILDALLYDGGVKKYIDSSNNLRYSEHSGILDFDKTKLERIIISGKSTREDEDDTDILLPHDFNDALDYEYIFHTHPPTPYPGGRAKDGILYEFPSVSDLYHFAYHYNEGNVQGSMIIAPEGIYIIRMKQDVKHIAEPPDEIADKLDRLNLKIQKLAIEEHGTDFKGLKGQQKYYHNVCQDKKYIKMFNKIVTQYFNQDMQIVYKPRKYDHKTNRWSIANLYVKVNPVEINYQ